MSDGRAWAAKSAKTLARRLRRAKQAELGIPRARALAFRTSLARQAIAEHWSLSDKIGGYYPTFGEALKAASVIGYVVPSHVGEAHHLGNWARHSPPPSARPAPASPAGIAVESLEDFRSYLFAQGQAIALTNLLQSLCSDSKEFGSDDIALLDGNSTLERQAEADSLAALAGTAGLEAPAPPSGAPVAPVACGDHKCAAPCKHTYSNELDEG